MNLSMNIYHILLAQLNMFANITFIPILNLQIRDRWIAIERMRKMLFGFGHGFMLKDLNDGTPYVFLKTMRTLAQMTIKHFFGESDLTERTNGSLILVIVLNDGI